MIIKSTALESETQTDSLTAKSTAKGSGIRRTAKRLLATTATCALISAATMMGSGTAFAECPTDSDEAILDFCFEDQAISILPSGGRPPVIVKVDIPILHDTPQLLGPNTVSPSLANLGFIYMERAHVPSGPSVPSLNNLTSLGPNASVSGKVYSRATVGTLLPPHGGTVIFGADAGILSDGEILDADAGAVKLPPVPSFGVGFDAGYDVHAQAGLGIFGDDVYVKSSGSISLRAPVSLAKLPGVYFFPFNAAPGPNGVPQGIYVPIVNGDLTPLKQLMANAAGGIISSSPTLASGATLQEIIANMVQANGGQLPASPLSQHPLANVVPAAVLQRLIGLVPDSIPGPHPFIGLSGPDSSGDLNLGIFVPGEPSLNPTPGIGVHFDIDDMSLSARNDWSVGVNGQDLYSGWNYLGGPLNENIIVPAGARLGGHGVIAGSTIVQAGGAIAPGIHGVGVLSAESFLFETGSVLQVDVDPVQNLADAVVAATTVTIQPGVTLDLNVINPQFLQDQQQFVIASAPVVSLEEPLFVQGVPTGFDFVAGVTPDSSLLLIQFMSQFLNFTQIAGLTENQLQVAQVLENLQLLNGTAANVNPLVDMIETLPANQQAGALDSLSGEGLVNIPEAAIADSSSFLGILSSRFGLVHDGGFLVGSRGGNTAERSFADISAGMRPLGSSQYSASIADKIFGTYGGAPLIAAASSISRDIHGPDGYAAWIEGYAVQGNLEARDAGSADTDYSVYGISAGADHLFEDIGLLFGAAFSYSYSTSEVDARSTEVDGNTFRASIYGGKALGRGYIAGAMSYAQTQFDSERAITFAGSAAEAQFDGNEFTAYIEGGYAFNPVGELIWEPVASARATNFEFDGYTEEGAGTANLTVASRTVESIEFSVGQRFRHPVEMRGDVTLVPELRTFYNFETKDLDRSVEATLGGATFLVTGAEAPNSTATVGVGLNAHLGDRQRLSFDYDAELASRLTEHTLAARFRWAF